MMKKKQYVSPSVLRAAPFAPRASLLAGSGPTSPFGASTSGQQIGGNHENVSAPGSTFNHEWE